MSLSDLKPCPFCGCDGWIVEDRSAPPLLYRPQCKMCGGGLGGFQYRDNAIMVWNTRAEGVAALQQAGEPISRENLEAELRETIGLYVREAVTRMFSEENSTYRCARQIAGMLQPGYYLHRKLFSSPLPQQTALVEPYSPDLDDVNGRLA